MSDVILIFGVLVYLAIGCISAGTYAGLNEPGMHEIVAFMIVIWIAWPLVHITAHVATKTLEKENIILQEKLEKLKRDDPE